MQCNTPYVNVKAVLYCELNRCLNETEFMHYTNLMHMPTFICMCTAIVDTVGTMLNGGAWPTIQIYHCFMG